MKHGNISKTSDSVAMAKVVREKQFIPSADKATRMYSSISELHQ